MLNRHPASHRHVGRTVLLIVGVLGALAAFDALLVLFVVLLAAGPAAYGGLLLGVALFIALFGIAVAWNAFTLLRPLEPEDDMTRPKVGA